MPDEPRPELREYTYTYSVGDVTVRVVAASEAEAEATALDEAHDALEGAFEAATVWHDGVRTLDEAEAAVAASERS
jgi:hypothetical protein